MEKNLLLNSLNYLFEEHKNMKNKIFRLSIENMHQQTLRTTLGIGWVFIRDIVYYVAFIMFRFLMSGAGKVEGINFILFLMVGLIPWNFMNECIGGGVMAIKTNKQIFASIKFPIVVLPTIEVIAIFMKRSFTLLILFFVVFIFGDIRSVTYWMVIYYFICMFVIMIVWNFIFSALVAISNDFEQMYRAVTSVLIFTMPIMWSFEVLKNYPNIIRVFKLNPFVYIIEGFRDAMCIGTFPDLEYTIYFWCLNAVLLAIGAILQYKLRRHFVDLI